MVIQLSQNSDRLKSRDRTVFSRNFANKPSDVNFKGSPFKMSEAAKKKFYLSKGFEKFAKMTAKPVLLEATAVLGLACVLRPLTILSLPGGEKRDKQYASAHGMASGIWGYVTAIVLFNPVSTALKKVAQRVDKDPEYLKNSFIKHNAKNKDAFNFIVSWGPKFVLQPLIAAGTIALIPTVMGLFFKKDKDGKNKTQQKPPIQKTNESSNISTSSKPKEPLTASFKAFENNSSQPQFKGQVPEKLNLGQKFIKKIESFIERAAGNKKVKNLSEKMANDKKTDSAVKNLFTSGTAFLGTLVYAGSTISSPKIEQDRKKTLAANQFIVWGVSAIVSAALGEAIKDKFKEMGENYQKYKRSHFEENIEKIMQEEEKQGFFKAIEKKQNKILTPLERTRELRANYLEKYKFRAGNIGSVAPTMIAFAFIYRYIVPVVATPLADFYKKNFMKEPTKVTPLKRPEVVKK
ncbi:MAG: hypothetical protein WCF95_01870 [bacterium]